MDKAWLASLPRDDSFMVPDDGVKLTALLVSAPAGRVRLLLWPLYLEFDAEDVAEVHEIPLPPQVRPQAAIAVEVRLRSRAPLLAVHNAEVLPAAALGGPLPFALATRPGQLTLPYSARYTEAVADYLRRHGLEAE